MLPPLLLPSVVAQDWIPFHHSPHAAAARAGAARLPHLPGWVGRDNVGQATIIGTEETTAQVGVREGHGQTCENMLPMLLIHHCSIELH